MTQHCNKNYCGRGILKERVEVWPQFKNSSYVPDVIVAGDLIVLVHDLCFHQHQDLLQKPQAHSKFDIHWIFGKYAEITVCHLQKASRSLVTLNYTEHVLC